MGIRLTKAFTPLTDEFVGQLGGHLGIFELADKNDQVIYIGFAGGRSLFGLRGALADIKQATTATQFRIEINSAYLTRYQELLMIYVADFGRLPKENKPEDAQNLGKLSPGAANGS